MPQTITATKAKAELLGLIDAADRLLVASAIDAGATFVTRDAKILGWAQRT